LSVGRWTSDVGRFLRCDSNSQLLTLNFQRPRIAAINIEILDLNHILVFIAVISPLLVLARALRPGGASRGWRVAALIVLAITAVSWILSPNQAGYVGGGAWFALLFIPAIGLRRVADLFAQQRYKPARRIAMLLQVLHPTAELRGQIQLLRTLESRPESAGVRGSRSRPTQDRHYRLRNAPAVLLFIALNVAMFLIEVARRSGGNPNVLHRLGALDPYSVLIGREYWRLLTALFLHYDVVHLLFNLFALYVLGPGLERAIGTFRFSLCYLISGLGSTAGVVLLTSVRLVQPAELVGASGCVMGIVGAWAGFLLRHRHLPRAHQRLLNILLIVAIQTAFDLSTPQVSMAAHVCGLITGFLLGLAIVRRPRSI
jgi:membrane associated rhomboid family serine protease